MIKHTITLLAMLSLLACQKPNNHKQQSTAETLTPGAVLAAASDDEWRLLNAENTLYLTLDTGTVVIELMPELAPNHVANTKALVRQGVFDGTQFYRVLDGFVAQGGPLFESEDELPPLSSGAYSIAAEFTYSGDLPDAYVAFDEADGYADQTGYLHSFPVGLDLSSNESWLLHCYGALGMGRSNELDTGGTALYIVNGPAQRYLDRNTTVFGRVVDGMAHIQALKRSAELDGPVDLTGHNLIKSIRVAADLPAADRMAIEVLDSSSAAFAKLLKSRQNRSGEWFVHQHDYMDACGVPIPVRRQPKPE